MDCQGIEVVFCRLLMTEVFVCCLGRGDFMMTHSIKLTLPSQMESAYKNYVIIIGIVRFALDYFL